MPALKIHWISSQVIINVVLGVRLSQGRSEVQIYNHDIRNSDTVSLTVYLLIFYITTDDKSIFYRVNL